MSNDKVPTNHANDDHHRNDAQLQALNLMMLEGIAKKDPEIIRGCIQQGGDPDVSVRENGKGASRPVLHWAMRNFNEAAAKEVLDASSSVDVRDPNGNTALFFAIENHDPAAVEFLMKNGADPAAQNDSGVVAMDAARNLDAYYYGKQRDSIIKALTHDYGLAARKEAPTTGTPAETPGETQVRNQTGEGLQDDTLSSRPPTGGSGGKDIKLLRPVTFEQPGRKDGTGFKL